MTETKPGQFIAFIENLMNSENAPSGYKPWLIPVKKNSKNPDVQLSWKHPKSRLTVAEAVRRLRKNNGNVGIAARRSDSLLLLDIDDPGITDQIKPSFKLMSRSRIGGHAFYWEDEECDKLPDNIPTDKGELRCEDQYVVAPGSYVPCTEEELQEKVEEGEITEEKMHEVLEDDFKGYYTVENDRKAENLSFNELPEVFQEEFHARNKRKEHSKETDYEPEQVEGSSNQSALYDLRITDLTSRGFDGRDPHPLHISTTGANWSISEGVGHCWRHEVSLNALQFLCVESGYLSCHEAGTPHKSSGSAVIDDDQAIWEAWLHAKKNGYIPKDDPVPVRAIHHIARKHGIADPQEFGDLSKDEWKTVLETIEVNY